MMSVRRKRQHPGLLRKNPQGFMGFWMAAAMAERAKKQKEDAYAETHGGFRTPRRKKS